MLRSIQAEDAVSIWAVATALNDRKIPTARGGRWHLPNVANLRANAQKPSGNGSKAPSGALSFCTERMRNMNLGVSTDDPSRQSGRLGFEVHTDCNYKPYRAVASEFLQMRASEIRPTLLAAGTPCRMEKKPDLETEIVALRLILRGVLAHILINTQRPLSEAIGVFNDAIDAMSPDQAAIRDVAPELQRRAAQLAKVRAEAMLAELGSLLAPKRTGRAHGGVRAKRSPPTLVSWEPS